MVCLLKIKKPGPRAKLNKKKILCNAKRPRQWERQKKNSVSLISKKKKKNKKRLCMCSTQSWFLYISLLLICKTTTWNLIVARFIMEEMSYVLTKNFVACVLVHCCSFSLCWPLEFFIFSPPPETFLVVFPTNFRSFVFHLLLSL